jgi:hypothetical protein
MHTRRLASILLGAWLAGGGFIVLVATHNFRAVDDLLAAPPPPAAEALAQLGSNARALLRYQASELNRSYFEAWEWAQLAVGAALLASLIWTDRRSRVTVALCALMLAIVLSMRLLLTPEVTRVGRLLDFLPPDQPSPDRDRFRSLHSAYSAAELVKLGFGLAIAALLLRRSHTRKGRSARTETVLKA